MSLIVVIDSRKWAARNVIVEYPTAGEHQVNRESSRRPVDSETFHTEAEHVENRSSHVLQQRDQWFLYPLMTQSVS